MKRKKKTAEILTEIDSRDFEELYARLTPEQKENFKDMLFIAKTVTNHAEKLPNLIRKLRSLNPDGLPVEMIQGCLDALTRKY